VAVPTHFYKVVFDPVRVETIAFVVPNAPQTSRRIEEFITSVRDIEQRTGLDFLNRINPSVQALIEESVASSLWQ
jgi:endonuclease G